MSVIGNIQQQVADALLADPFFTYITVITEAVGDILNSFDTAMGAAASVGGKTGAFVCVMSPDANANFAELRGPYFDELSIQVQVVYNASLANDPDSGVGVTDLDICEKIAAIVSLMFPAAANAPMAPDTPTIKLMARNDNESVRMVRFKTQCGINVLPAYASTPAIVNNAGVISMMTMTPGAAIFYTLDGSNPVPLNQRQNTMLYLAPFTPGPGVLIKARAYLAGYLNSQLNQITT